MSPSELFILGARWLHTLAAVAWVGGGLFYLLALRPALQGSSFSENINKRVAQEFRNVVDTAIWVLLVTGAILFLNRVTSDHATVPYGIVLGLKIALAVWMFYLVGFRQRRSAASWEESAGSGRPLLRRAKAVFSGTNLILILGVVVLLLSSILGELFEIDLTNG
ncbi:MAG: hypothetical protein O6920_03655 [Chloroflexi bacterium]|nr:hypothetical protein [Chloroflexota bacterium]